MSDYVNIIQGDCLDVLKTMSDESVGCVITSPPYWNLRDYGCEGQLGLEKTPEEYVANLVMVFSEVKRVLKKEGTCWVNIGDTYGGSGKGSSGSSEKAPESIGDVQKCLCQIPSRFAIEMTNRGWILRNEIIWHKPNCMPSSAEDRFTVDFEKVFFFVKSKKYYFDADAVKEDAQNWGTRDRTHFRGGTTDPKLKHHGLTGSNEENQRRNKRSVWTVNTKPFTGAHFAVFPEELIKPCVLAGCPLGGIVIDPFSGSGTTGKVAIDNGRKYIGIELNPEYIEIQKKRLCEVSLFEMLN